MQLQTFQAVLGWEPQHINKLTTALKKNLFFSGVDWSRDPDQFHAQLLDTFSDPATISRFRSMVESVEFDSRNRDNKQLQKNNKRYSIRGRWLSRTLEFINKESEFPESVHERIQHALISGDYEAPLQITLEALGKIPGGESYIAFSNWLEALDGETDDEIEETESPAKAMFDAIVVAGSRPELEKAFRAQYKTEKEVRELLKDGMSALAKTSIDGMLADPSGVLSIISDLACALVFTENATWASECRRQVRLIYQVLELGPSEDVDKVCESVLKAPKYDPETLMALDELDSICQIIERISVTTMEERDCQKALQEAAQQGDYQAIPSLAEKAQKAQSALAEILSLLKSGEAKLPIEILAKADTTENDAIIFIIKALKACSNANPKNVADAYYKYPSDQLPSKPHEPEETKSTHQEPSKPESPPDRQDSNTVSTSSVQTESLIAANPINQGVRNALKSAFSAPQLSAEQSLVACSTALPYMPLAQKTQPPATPAEPLLIPQPDRSAAQIEIEAAAKPAAPMSPDVPSEVNEQASEPAPAATAPVRAEPEPVDAYAQAAMVEAALRQDIGESEAVVSTEIPHQNGAAALEGCFAACAEERFDVAFWLSWLANRSKRAGWNHNAFSAFVFGNRILPDGFIGGELISCLSALHAADFDNAPHNRLLLTGGLLAPTLFCADKHAVLYALRDHTETGFPKLDELIANIFDLGINKAIYLTPSDVKRAGVSTDHNKALVALAQESANELRKAQVSKMSFWPGECLLHAIYKDGTPLSTLHQVVSANDVARLGEARRLLNTISPEHLTESYELAPGLDPSKCPPMIGPARVRFLRYINTTLSIARRWAELHDAASGTVDTFRHKEIEGLREYVKRSVAAVIHEIKSNLGRVSPTMDAALHSISFAVSRVAKVLAGDQLSAERDIYTMLAPHPGVVLDDDFAPAIGAEDGLVEMLQKGLPPDPTSAFAAAIERYEFVRAKFLLDQYALGERAQDDFDRAFEKACTKLDTQVDDLETRVEDAYLLGELTEFQSSERQDGDMQDQHVTRSEMLGKLISARTALQSNRSAEEPRLLDVLAKVTEVAEFTERIKQVSRTKMQARSDNIAREFPATPEGSEDRQYFIEHFTRSIEAGDQVAASEIVHQAEQAIRTNSRLALMPINGCTELQEFENVEPTIQAEIEKSLMRLDGVGASIRAGEVVFGLNFAAISEVQRDTAAKVIEALQRMKDSTTSDPTLNAVQVIISTLGFELQLNAAKVRLRGNDYRVVDCELRFDPNCPIPAFGTNLNKRLTVLVLMRRFTEEELRELVGQLGLKRTPVISLFLPPVSMASRQRLRALCAIDQMEMLTVDFCNLLFIMSRANRLQTLFEIALPFAYSQPYLMKGENVPAEMFVGREKEIVSLLDKDGACIVFGGRQLGKSASLRHLINKYHAPVSNQFLVYRDIDDLGAGTEAYEQVRYTFWEYIASEITQCGFADLRAIKARGHYRTIEAAVTNAIKEVFAKSPAVRLTVLLDEADDLINLDAQEADFGLIKTIRGLMVDTNRRFKCIFAGLQSVQQFSRWPNHPFAQLGREIVISPLPPEAAQRLVVTPMRALGFQFGSPELVLRILSTVNYHPGLIQIFCYRLLSRFYEKAGRQKKAERAVRTITRDDIREIERTRDLIDDIRDRFDWSLDLDDRYKLLTYALVLSGNPTMPRTESEFQKLGSYWWAPEFASMDLASIRSLLEEMEGLGVLVRTDVGGVRTYQLRSPNLLRLLGNRDAIEQEMQRLIAQQSRRKANPREFHAFTSGKSAHFSPFTMGQEAEIFSRPEPFALTIFFGSEALGMSRIDDYIARIGKAVGDGTDGWMRRDVSAQFCTSTDRFAEEVSRLLKPRDRKHLFMLASTDSWSDDISQTKAIAEIEAACFRTCSKNSKGRVFLNGGSSMLWKWLVERRQSRLNRGNPSEIILQPWSDGAIWNAFEKADIRNKAKQTSGEILAKTGGFQFLIEDLISECRARSISSADAALPVLDELLASAAEADLRDTFGISGLPPSLRCVAETFFPLAIEAAPNKGMYVATRSSISVVVSELDSSDMASVFGDLGRDAATDLLIQWMTLLGLVRGLAHTADTFAVPSIVVQSCFKGC